MEECPKFTSAAVLTFGDSNLLLHLEAAWTTGTFAVGANLACLLRHLQEDPDLGAEAEKIKKVKREKNRG